MNNKTAIIIGAGGQDGKIMHEFLEKKDYNILGIKRDQSIVSGTVFKEYKDRIIDILKPHEIGNLVKNTTPDEIYYLAAYHHSSQDVPPPDTELFEKSRQVHVDGYHHVLQSIKSYSPHTKICYASSCLIYGGTDTHQQNEKTLPAPNSPYAITKLEGMHLGNWYAEKYGLSVVNAILYNHESEYRDPKFVSMKVIQGAINIKKGIQETITLGDLSTQVDRGYAGDYVEAMWQLLQTDITGDYIISSGKLHTIQELVEIVFAKVGLDREKHILTNPSIIQRKKGLLFGDTTNIMQNTGWVPKVGFEEMAERMLQAHR